MKIIIEDPKIGEEESILVKCHHITSQTRDLLNSFKEQENKLLVTIGSEIFKLRAEEVFYIETMDNKTFIYGEREVY